MAAVPRPEPEAAPPLPTDRRFEAVVFDWDGTAVPDRQADAAAVRSVLERLVALGMDVVVVSGTHVGNVDGQLAARPAPSATGRLLLCLNRGSEVFAVGTAGPELVLRRKATAAEDAALTRAAESTVARLAERGLEARIVSQRLNRRKIDLIPLPEWQDPPKAQIGALLTGVEERLHQHGLAGLRDAVDIARAAAVEAGLADPRVTSDVKHVEIGLTDKADSARWAFDELWRRGVAPAQVLVAGDEMGPLGGMTGSDALMLVDPRVTAVSVGPEPAGVPHGVLHLGGGPARFVAILDDQVARRSRGEIPVAADDAQWAVRIAETDPSQRRAHAALATIADGRVGAVGGGLGGDSQSSPVLAAGVFAGEGPDTHLLEAPGFGRLAGPPAPLERLLDLHAGTLLSTARIGGRTVQALEFCSLARPGTAVLRVDDATALGDDVVSPPARDGEQEWGEDGDEQWMEVSSGTGSLAAAGRQGGGTRCATDRVVSYAEHVGEARRRLGDVHSMGVDALLSEHRAAWGQRWDDAAISVAGDAEAEQAIRFALFHLMGSVADEGEAAVGARGMTGHGYNGHVFWDADVFVLPFLAATHPAAARAMLEYRIRRLPAALDAAREAGRAGARFPWESALSGRDVTPVEGHDRLGHVLRIRTGELEEHIVADVAWAACCYADWSGDEEFLPGPGLPLLLETARYWASRIEVDNRGRGHIRRVIGPDEYHEDVDDNAYTNVMARWNLRAAARLAASVQGSATPAELAGWRHLATHLVDNHHRGSGLYEQFSGFWRLEPLIIRDVAPRRPVVADILLGGDRVRGAQVVKQADVLMLHHLVPEEVAAGSLLPNLDHYEPRTAHGSSLSPLVHASLLARAGRTAQALEMLRTGMRIDLDDVTGATAAGLHLATMGGLWQAVVWGVAGLRPAGRALSIDPRPLQAWGRLDIRLRFRGSSVRVVVEPDRARVDADPPIPVRGPDGGRARTVAHAEFVLPPEGRP
jgi:hypothetical protein